MNRFALIARKAFRYLCIHAAECACVFVLGSSLYLLYLPSEIGSALFIPPDSSEYAIGLINLFEHGTFGISLNGAWYPSRYSPWFSLSCLTPAYVLGGGNVLKMHWSILGFATAVIFMVWKWGKTVGLGWKSIFPMVALFFMPDFVFYSRIVMTEIPYTAVLALLGILYVRWLDLGRENAFSCKMTASLGVLLAWGGMIRPTLLPMVVLFGAPIFRCALTWRRRLFLLLVLVAPIIAYETGNAIYNLCVFGSPTRSGYQFWVPIPCDFPDQMFNLNNVVDNVCKLSKLPFWWITVIMLLVSNIGGLRWIKSCGEMEKASENYRCLLIFVDAQMVIVGILYIGYFWCDTRFFLPVTICCLPLFYRSCVCLLSRRCSRIGWGGHLIVFLGVTATLLLAIPKYYWIPYSRQVWLAKAQIAAHVLPENSVVLQGGDPNVLDHFGFRVRHLTLLPYERKFDYVKSMVAPTSVRNLKPRPTSWRQVYIREHIESGVCKLPFPKTFLEAPEQVVALINQGRRVFLEQGVLGGEDDWPLFQSKLRSLGLQSRLYGAWELDAIEHSPIRGIYDSILFRDFRMDSRPVVPAVYHEILLSD